MHADPEFELFLRSVSDDEVLDFVKQSQTHLRNLGGVLVMSLWQTRHHHVGVTCKIPCFQSLFFEKNTDGFDFVDLEVVHNAVEGEVEVVEQGDDLGS